MTMQAVEALEHEIAAVISLSDGWSADQWDAPTRAFGWSRKDVLCHLGAVFQQLCDPDGVPVDPSLGEHSVDLAVEARRHLVPHEVHDQYVAWGQRALAMLATMQEPDIANRVVPMGILGAHRTHLLANAYAFDHHCHIRHDLDLASGDLWPHDADPRELTEAAVEWMIAAAPQMCGASFGHLSGSVELQIDGAVWMLASEPGRGIEIAAPNDVVDARTRLRPVIARIRSSAEDFVLWGTQRVPLTELDVEISGNGRVAQFVIDNFKVF